MVIGKAGSNIKESEAFKYVAGYALALDLTARDIQVSPAGVKCVCVCVLFLLNAAPFLSRLPQRRTDYLGARLKATTHFVQLGKRMVQLQR